jgi:hypothetical protein
LAGSLLPPQATRPRATQKLEMRVRFRMRAVKQGSCQRRELSVLRFVWRSEGAVTVADEPPRDIPRRHSRRARESGPVLELRSHFIPLSKETRRLSARPTERLARLGGA